MHYDPNSQWRQQQPPPPPQWTTQPGQWQRLSKTGKFSVGCLTFAVILCFCVLCRGVVGSSTPMSPQTASVATMPTQTDTPTVQPTPTEEPTPTPIPTPTAAPMPASQPTQPPAPAPPPPPPPAQPTYNTNPSGGHLVYSPPIDFCGTNACVTTFWKDTNGYVVQCANGEYSHSGGVSGACSRDGGVAAALYQHG